MPSYRNGFVPENLLVKFNSGYNDVDGEWWQGFPPATYARHLALVARAQKRTGRTLRLTIGWSAYRPYFAQVIARRVHGLGAADPGTSSHGGFWENRQTMAGDYGNWAFVYANHGGQAAFFEDVRAVGLLPGMIMRSRGYPDEPWHVIDPDPWGPVPAFSDVTPFQAPKPRTGGIPMFALVAVPDTGLIFVVGEDGRREGVQSAADLEALLALREAQFATGSTITSIYYGDFVGARGHLDWYLERVNGPRDAETLKKLDELRDAIAKVDAEFDGQPHVFTAEELAQIGAAAGASIDVTVDEILASLNSMPQAVVEELKARLRVEIA